MAYFRLSSADPRGTNYINIVLEDLGLPISGYSSIILYCSNGAQVAIDNLIYNGSSYRSDVITFSGLASNTAYSFYCYATPANSGVSRRIADYYNPNGVFYDVADSYGSNIGTTGVASYATLQGVSAPAKPSITVASENGRTVTLRAYISTNTTSVEWDDTRWNGGSYDVDYVSNQTYIDRTWTVPAWGTGYQWDVIAKNSAGSSPWSDVFTWASPPAPIEQVTGLGVYEYKPDAIGLTWNTASNAGSYQVQYKPASSSTWITAVNPTYGTSYKVTGLNSLTDYHFRVRGRAGDEYGDWSTTLLARTLDDIPIPFGWTYAKAQNGNYNLTANEWNALASKINQFRQYKNMSTYPFSAAYYNEIFYAYMANEARSAIADMSPSISPPVQRYSDDIVEAAVLNRLRDSLNSVI